MIKKIVCVIAGLFWSAATALDHYPLRVIIANKTNQDLTFSLEYRLDQHYASNEKAGMPFVPNNTQLHTLGTVPAGKETTIPVFAFSPCAQQYCFLDQNLRSYGFKPHYKTVHGSVTIKQYKRSYDFKQALFDDGVITLTLEGKDSLKGSATRPFKAMQICYATGVCDLP